MSRRALAIALLVAACNRAEGPAATPPPDAGPATICAPGSVIACYEGPAATVGVGVCAAGAMTCNAEGTAFGPCVGQTLPSGPDCDGDTDDDCDGAPGCRGRAQWTLPLPFAADPLLGVAEDGSISVASTPPASATIVHLAPDGTTIWSRNLSAGGLVEVSAIAVDAAGRTFVSGRCTAGTVDLGTGTELVGDNGGLFIAAYDALGAPLWHRFTGSMNLDRLAVTPAGEITVAGLVLRQYDLDDNPLPFLSFGAVARLSLDGKLLWSLPLGSAQPWLIAVAEDGSVTCGGTLSEMTDLGGGPIGPAEGSAAFLARFDAQGAHVWSRLSANGEDLGLAAGTADALAHSGLHDGNVDLDAAHGCPPPPEGRTGVFAAALDGAGNTAWSRCLAAPSGTRVIPAVGPQGDRAFAGTVPALAGADPIDLGGGPIAARSPVTGLAYSFVAVYAPGCAIRFARRLDLGPRATVNGVRGAAFDGAGNLVVAGRSSGTIDLGDGAIIAPADGTAFVTRLAP